MSQLDTHDAISAREVGHYPISIGTSRSLEGLSGANPEIPVQRGYDLKRFAVFLVNVDTLVRNFVASLEKSVVITLSPEDMAEAVATEMDDIKDIISSVSPTTEVHYYHTPYMQLTRMFPHAHYKKLPPSQLLYRGIADEVLAVLAMMRPYITLTRLRWEHTSATVLTHKPADLLLGRTFSQLILLESHTGRVKSERQWWTKLNRCQVEKMPFNGFTYQIYGDNLYLATQPIKLKKAVEDLAKLHRWDHDTTTSRIRMGISGLKDKELRDRLTPFLEFKLDVT